MAAAVKGAQSPPTDAPPPKSGPSLVVQLGVLVVMTLAALGMGWVSGGFPDRRQDPKPRQPAMRPAAGGHGDGKGEGGHGEEAPPSETIIPLAAVTTNIASPSDVWVRMEVSIVLDEPQVEPSFPASSSRTCSPTSAP